MYPFFLIWLLLLVASTVESSNELVLSEDYKGTLAEFGRVLLQFYSPTCPHCQDFAKTWNEVQNYATSVNTTVKFCQVDGESPFAHALKNSKINL